VDQFRQLQNDLRQVRQEINNTLNQVNQRLVNSEQMIQNISNQVSQQGQFNTLGNFASQYNTGQYSRSQYNPNNIQSASSYTNKGTNTNRENINPISGLSENRPTMVQQGGVNKYGASYTSGNDFGK